MNKKKNKNKKDYKYIIVIVLLLILAGIIIFIKLKKDKDAEIDINYVKFERTSAIILNNYNDYLENKNLLKESNENYLINESDFKDNIYVLITYDIDDCQEKINKKNFNVKNNILNIYYDISYNCGVCAPRVQTDVFKIARDLKFSTIEAYYNVSKREYCEPNIAYKPMIYIYPKEEVDLTIKLGNEKLLTSTYPKYNNLWNIRVSKDGNIYDYNTKRNYYGLYWEAFDNKKLDFKEGFIVKGSETIKFLEEKLHFLGLNEYEINEFIVYWLNKLENNNYNYIYFRNLKEINEYMPLIINHSPDTLIRILVDFKPLDSYIEVKEQNLEGIERKGFTIVELGGVYHR